MIGSSLVFKWSIVHDGVILRSDDEFGEVINSGTSAALWSDMFHCTIPVTKAAVESVARLDVPGDIMRSKVLWFVFVITTDAGLNQSHGPEICGTCISRTRHILLVRYISFSFR